MPSTDRSGTRLSGTNSKKKCPKQNLMYCKTDREHKQPSFVLLCSVLGEFPYPLSLW